MLYLSKMLRNKGKYPSSIPFLFRICGWGWDLGWVVALPQRVYHGRWKQNFIDPAISLLFIVINYPPTFVHY